MIEWIRTWWPWSVIKTLKNNLQEVRNQHKEVAEELLEVTEKYEKSCRDIIEAAKTYKAMKTHYEQRITEIEVKQAFSEDSSTE